MVKVTAVLLATQLPLAMVSVIVTTPAGSNSPNTLFTYVVAGTTFTQILGQPTDHNATINVRASAPRELVPNP